VAPAAGRGFLSCRARLFSTLHCITPGKDSDMLVLSRKHGQRIFAGCVELLIVETSDNKCRLGINAPKALPIFREEVLTAIHRANPAELHDLGYEINSEGVVVPRPDFFVRS
jgi:carbon storage regulator